LEPLVEYYDGGHWTTGPWNLGATPRAAGATAWILYSATAELPVLREGCVCPGRLGGRDRVRSG